MMAGPSVTSLGPRVLRGSSILLEPFQPDHLADMRRAATDETFRYFPTPDFESWSTKLLRDGETRQCFTVRRLADSAVIGSTSYSDIAPGDARVEIGSTWYVAEARGTAVNPEAKLLLLGNAFDAGYNCVALRTDSRNAQSRAAILKLGAKQDGILRGHVWMPPGGARSEGYFRDPVFFSILAGEWPKVKAGLEKRLEGTR
jgi:RimJ/RimL family protein N-acetyltransferase